jgi:hypothetical protein
LGPEPSKLRFYLFALVVGGVSLAIAFPVVIDHLDSRIYTPFDVERVVGFHPLGVLLDGDEFRQEIAGEYYFRLAAGIDHAVRSSGSRVFLFTAPAHGSGTSTVVHAVGEKLRGLNLRTQTITMPGTESAAGSNAMALRITPLPDPLSQKTDLARTELVPLALRPDHSTRRGAADTGGMASMAPSLHSAKEQFDVILIDAKPLPISANTEYLSRVSDATVLVVRSSATTKAELDRSARLLERLQVAGVAVVLNKVSRDRADRALRGELARYEQVYGKRGSRTKKGTGRED